MVDKTILVSGMFVILALVGTTFVVLQEDNVYYCKDTNLVGICWQLSKPNLEGLQTRCYYDEFLPTRYKVCNSGWFLYEQKEIVGTLEVNITPVLLYNSTITSELDKVDLKNFNFNFVKNYSDAYQFSVNGDINKKYKIFKTFTNCTKYETKPSMNEEDYITCSIPELCNNYTFCTEYETLNKTFDQILDELANVFDKELQRQYDVKLERDIKFNVSVYDIKSEDINIIINRR